VTTFSPDSPDWFGGATGGIMLHDFVSLGPRGIAQLGLSGATGVIVVASSFGAGLPVLCGIQFSAEFNGGAPVFSIYLTADDNPNGGGVATVDSPTYGAGMAVGNYDTVNDLNIDYYTTNRVIDAVRIEPCSAPGRIFIYSDVYVAGTAVFVPAFDDINAGYANNGSAGITANSSDAGLLEFRYRTWFGTQFTIPLLTLAAGVTGQATVPLPQCIGSIIFTPTTNNAAGTITVQMSPAQL
jgi:hypothetical protein